ncbi:hypothetical protein JOD64_002193 [Micromonospora luteifusca]|uniref:Uncharacterized protein n=1 Tax=Micromonospora luteifusca TaxID=709860 RepID=A0ABS2LS08_9ACTN|nr:hypothetical protein [Micromonospora luteifusca]MBM7490971.1 hypothetical protein [Micromonospora luteifusca]
MIIGDAEVGVPALVFDQSVSQRGRELLGSVISAFDIQQCPHVGLVATSSSGDVLPIDPGNPKAPDLQVTSDAKALGYNPSLQHDAHDETRV